MMNQNNTIKKHCFRFPKIKVSEMQLIETYEDFDIIVNTYFCLECGENHLLGTNKAYQNSVAYTVRRSA